MDRTPTSKEQPAAEAARVCPACSGKLEQAKTTGFECPDCGRLFYSHHGKMYEMKGHDHEA